MKIKYVKGDLLQASERCILHGCNAQSTMNSGVAKLIRAKWPSAYTVYKASEQHDGMRLGVVTYAQQDDGKIIFNGITQEFYGRVPNRCYVSYEAIKEVIQAMNYFMEHPDGLFEEGEIPSVAMPMIGAGLGGGDWEIISKIIEEESISFQPVVYYLED